MNRSSRIVVSIFVLLGVLAMTNCSRRMTLERFQELVDAPGDDVPLVPLIANANPQWKHSTVSMAIHLADGRDYFDEFPMTAKTIRGRYVVLVAKSNLSKQESHIVIAAEKESGPLKVYAVNDDKLVGADVIYDAVAKTHTASAPFGDGFVQTTTGHWSDTEDVSHTEVYHHGKLFMTRETTNRPVAASQ